MTDRTLPVIDVESLRVVHTRRGRGARQLVAVDDVSVTVGQGEIVGVVGESGSGKTSLAMAITGLGRMSGGSVSLLGTDLTSLGARELRKARVDIQVVFQDPHGSLDPRQSVKAGLTELRKLQPERSAWITDDELMQRVKLAPEILSRYPHQLSGGQAQRVCIARALLAHPRLLVTDEPTSGLDVSVQADVLQLLLELRDSAGISILFISHDLSVVRLLCDRVYVMLDGAVVEEGTAEDVLERPSHPYTRKLVAAIPGRAQVAGDGAGTLVEAPVESVPRTKLSTGQRLRSIGRFMGSKLLWAAVTLALALTFAFILGRASGDPIVSILGPFATQDQVKALRHEIGLDRPLLRQYLTYMGDTARGDLGQSLQYARPNTELVQSRLGNSVKLLLAAMAIAVFVGVPLGVLAGLKEGTTWDRLASGVALVGQSIPIFWLGLILVLVFAVRWHVFPAGQEGGFSHLVLPAITLSLYPTAHIARLTRSAMAETLHEPYIVAARARGIHSASIVWKHALRNASPPILTVTALQAGTLLSGAVAVEYVFSWPGLGLLALDAVSFHDYTLVQAIVIVGAVAFVLITLTVDLLYGVIDPRIREGAR
jgi:peptide/nickel transport system permease protein